jgi:hypothetical protein
MKTTKSTSAIMTLIFLLGCSGHKPSLLSSTDQVKDACEIFTKQQEEFSRKSKRDARKYKPKFSASTQKKDLKAQPNKVDLFTPQPVVTRQFIHATMNQPAVKESSADITTENKLISTDQYTPNTPSLQPAESNTINREKIKSQPEKIKFTSSIQSLSIMALAGLASLGLIKGAKKGTQKLSRWGKSNPNASRSLIVGTTAAVGTGSLLLGHTLFTEQLLIPAWAQFTTYGVFASALVLYPTAHSYSSRASNYLNRKFYDATLFTTGAMLMACVGNTHHIQYTSTQLPETVLSIPHHTTSNYIYVVKNNFSDTIQPTKSKSDSKSKGEKIGLTILVSIAFLIAVYGVAALSCSIACSGNEGLAAGVLFGGIALSILLLVVLLKKIWNKSNRKAEAQPVTN